MVRTLLALSIAGIIGGQALYSAAVYAEPVSWDQQQEQWLTQESAHFNLHFRKGHEAQASRALDIAEQVHQELTPFFGAAPENKTEFALVDEYDYSNGWATPLPFAQIRLIMSQPEDVNSLENNDEWMHMLIRHEYVHILHMEMSGGTVKVLRNIFGRNLFLFPHALTPSFMAEGLAVYLETNKELGYGRLQGSNYAMEMRVEVASGEVKDLSQVAVAARELPLGYYYLYGAYFMQYLTETYGEDKLQQFLQAYSRKLLPYFLLQGTAERTFGKDFDTLWSDFQVYLYDRFNGDISAMLDEAVTGDAVFTAPFMQVMTNSDNGLLVDINNGEDRSVITRLGKGESTLTDDSNWQPINHESSIISMDDSAKHGVIASRLNQYADGRVLADLYWMENSDWHRLTERARFRKARWIGESFSVLASRKEDGLSELWLLDVKQPESRSMVWQGGEDTVLGDFDISWDGKTLVASIKRPNQGWNLELLDLTSYQWRTLTDSKAVENSPHFLADGRIFYSADYDGVYNIYAIEPKSGEVAQVTQELGGAFAPVWQKGEGLVYQSYGAEGYTVRAIATPQSIKNFAITEVQGRFDYPDPVKTIAEKSEPEPYSPWSTLRPRTWFPIVLSDDQQTQIGAMTNGADALGRHNYSISATWDTENDLAAYNIIYQYDNRWLAQINRSHDFSTFTQSGRESYRIERDDSALLQRSHIFTAFDDELSLEAGLVWDKSSEARAPAFGATTPYISKEETLTGLALTFDNRETFLNVPGVGWGHYADLVAETNEVFSSDYQGEKYQARWNMTFDLPGRTTATLHLAGGYADSKAKRFKIGGSDFEESIGLFGRDSQVLRGYDESVQVGERYATQGVDVTTWLGRFERNWGLYPIGLGDISGSLFVDSGSAWNQGESAHQLTGAGVSLTVETIVGYNIRLPITVGYAHGFDNKVGKDKVYVTIMGTF